MAKKLSAFEQAFADARANGEKTFSFNGKTYGTTTMDDVQKKIDAMPSMNRTTGVTVTTQGATYPKSSTDDGGVKSKNRSSWDSTFGEDAASGFERAKRGESPLNDAIMGAGKLAIAAIPAGKVLSAARPLVGAAVKYMTKKDSPAASALDDIKAEDPPLFTPNMKRPDSLFGNASARDFKKGGVANKYAKGGKINLAACGVSTHTPSKKNPNF